MQRLETARGGNEAEREINSFASRCARNGMSLQLFEHLVSNSKDFDLDAVAKDVFQNKDDLERINQIINTVLNTEIDGDLLHHSYSALDTIKVFSVLLPVWNRADKASEFATELTMKQLKVKPREIIMRRAYHGLNEIDSINSVIGMNFREYAQLLSEDDKKKLLEYLLEVAPLSVLPSLNLDEVPEKFKREYELANNSYFIKNDGRSIQLAATVPDRISRGCCEDAEINFRMAVNFGTARFAMVNNQFIGVAKRNPAPGVLSLRTVVKDEKVLILRGGIYYAYTSRSEKKVTWVPLRMSTIAESSLKQIEKDLKK